MYIYIIYYRYVLLFFVAFFFVFIRTFIIALSPGTRPSYILLMFASEKP